MSKIETTSKVSLKLTSRINLGSLALDFGHSSQAASTRNEALAKKYASTMEKPASPGKKIEHGFQQQENIHPAKINSPKPQSRPPKAAKAPNKSILSPLDRKQASTIRNEEPRQKLPPVAAIFEKKYKKIVFTSQKLSFCSWNKALY